MASGVTGSWQGGTGFHLSDACVRRFVERQCVLPAGTETQVDATLTVLEELIQPFAPAQFPRGLETYKLRALLDAPLCARVPLSPDLYSSVPDFGRDFFVPSATSSALPLSDKLRAALTAEPPKGRASEMSHVMFWASVGYMLPMYVCCALSMDVQVERCVINRPHLLQAPALNELGEVRACCAGKRQLSM